MLLSGVEDDPSKSHSPFRGVAGKQTFFERPDNEKEFSQDDMSLKDQRDYNNFQFGEEPYVPVAVAKKHISLMEADMRRMKDNYGNTMKDLESGYLRLEEKNREIYKRTLGAWRNKAKNKIKQFQDALKKSIDERNEIETNLKERIKKLRIEKDRFEKEKAFLLGENQAGKDEIQEKAKLLDEIKNSYQLEIKDKEDAIDQREGQIDKMKDEQEELRTKIEAEKEALSEDLKNQLTETKELLEKEASKREELEEQLRDAKENAVITNAQHPVGSKHSQRRLNSAGGVLVDEDGHSDHDQSEIRSLFSGKNATAEKGQLSHVGSEKVQVSHIAPVGAVYTGKTSQDTKDLLERIDKLESENAQLDDDKLELAKAVKNMNDILKESRKQMDIQTKQIEDAEKQGAEILAPEVVEERSKMTKKKDKAKKKNKARIRPGDAEEDDEDEDETEVFKENKALKHMIDNLVPEEERNDTLQDAKSIMMVYNSKSEDLEKEIKRLNRENELLKKSIEELNKRSQENDGETLDNLMDENKAFISQIKNLKKQVSEFKEVNSSLARDQSRVGSSVINNKSALHQTTEEDGPKQSNDRTIVIPAEMNDGF
jgi:chromosome segregation ATPase